MRGHDLDKRLSDLWNRRDELSGAELEELCLLVREILLRHAQRNRLMAALRDFGEEPEDLVGDFIVYKVLRNAGTRCDGARALRFFFDNFMRDKLREWQRWRQLMDDSGQQEEDPEWPDRQMAKPSKDELEVESELEEGLWEYGLTVDGVRREACRWLECQESWVLLFLGLHFCPDRETRWPLSTVAKAYEIPAYHHKARKLGITFRRGEIASERFRETLLGRWITSLGIPLDGSDLPAILTVLKILCLEALLQIERRS